MALSAAHNAGEAACRLLMQGRALLLCRTTQTRCCRSVVLLRVDGASQKLAARHCCSSVNAIMPKRRRSTAAAQEACHPLSAVAPLAGVSQEQPQHEQQQQQQQQQGQARSTAAAKGGFRFWHEERRFKGPGAVCVVQEALFAAGGVRTGGYPKAAPIPGPLGYQRPGDWDLLWSPARLALRAVPSLKPGQLISSSPGMMSLTRKRKLPATLRSALGEAAWLITPRSFSLPEELPQLRAHMDERLEAGAGEELWVLKTSQHLGKGLRLVPANEVCDEAGKRHVTAGEKGKPATSKPYVMAQRYVADPLLVQGRKFGIRVWVLVLGPNPLRAYLHSNGLVLFATHGYSSDEWRGEGGGVGLGHVTNYAQNVDGLVWGLEQLKQHLGEEAFGRLWDQVARSAALLCSAALGHMRAEHAALGVPQESAFELLGLDYLVDSSLHPWLLEVNGTPSLAVDHCQPAVEQLIRAQKGGMVEDMFQLLNVAQRFAPRYEALRLAAKQQAQRKAVLAARALQQQREQQQQQGGVSRVAARRARSVGADEEEDEEEQEREEAEEEDDVDAEEGGVDAADQDMSAVAGVSGAAAAAKEGGDDTRDQGAGRGPAGSGASAATAVAGAARGRTLSDGDADEGDEEDELLRGGGSAMQGVEGAAAAAAAAASGKRRPIRVPLAAAASGSGSRAGGAVVRTGGGGGGGAASSLAGSSLTGQAKGSARATADAGAAAAAAAATGAGKEAPTVLPRRLRDALCPKSESAIRQRVAQELQQRGRFQPLMSLFPLPAGPAAGGAGAAAAAAGPSGSGGQQQVVWSSVAPAGASQQGDAAAAAAQQCSTPQASGASSVARLTEALRVGESPSSGSPLQGKRRGVAAGGGGGGGGGRAGAAPATATPMEEAQRVATEAALVPWALQDVRLAASLRAL